jgi:uncharacterized protein (TIGR03382 family)
MRFRGSAVLVGSLLLTTTAGAAVPRTARTGVIGPVIPADTLTAMPAAAVARPLRTQGALRWSHPATAAWQKLAASGAWRAAWDRATGVPSRIWGPGIAAPGAMASPAIAERFARAALAEHIALLAPGAAPADFVLVSNTSDGDIRSVGFVQTHGGRVVVGGQISFRFKRDRLFVIGSEALPDVALPARPRARLATTELRDRAASALRRDVAPDLPAGAPVTPPGDEVVLPLVGDDAVLGYRLAVPVTVDGGASGRYLAYSDPATGEVLAVHQMNLFSTGTVLYHAIDRYPARPRIDRPAPLAHVALDGVMQTTSAAGQVTWDGVGPNPTITVTTSVVGDLAAIVNKASGGALVTAQLPLAAGSQLVWDVSAAPEDDAQVQAFLNANLANGFARELDPALPTLTRQLVVNVNIAQDCNAFFDGKTLNFFHASSRCQNTALIQDVVFHEYGHSVHAAEIISGVGAFDGAMSEGAADFFAAQITGDPAMGRGFFYTDAPLRDLDPAASESRWPDDIGEIHKTGIIFGGAFWDLRKALIASLGEAAGIQVTEKLFIGALRRSTSIPNSLIEVLAADDDDGDLSNGTPHECAIRDAYGRHGLRTAGGTIQAPDRIAGAMPSIPVHIELSGLATHCAGDELDHTDLSWKSDDGGLASGMARATQRTPTEFAADLPLADNTTVLYQANVVFKDGSVLTLPDNLADPYYQLYDGQTVTLYCNDFEAGDPLRSGWATGTGDGAQSPWVWGSPMSGTTDPPAAFSGKHALIQNLNGDYAPKSSSFVKMPTIDIGRWSDVHLQYRRWLAVEDSHFDQARITVGGRQAWLNYSQNIGDTSAGQHLDREWRFHDVAVSGLQTGHSLDIAWDLTSDEGLEFGGWGIDDVCVVANVHGVCGDGVITAHEACDDGPNNADAPGACRTYCQLPACGDRIIDSGEQCDTGPDGDAGCTPDCQRVEPPSLGGCCSAAGGAGSSIGLGAAVLGLVLRRRRRPLL